MPNKTERILGYLPRTFRALPKPTALYSLVDAFGGELLQGENSLGALMLAHWVEHADRGAELIDDLARIAALYGLAPRPDEGVEEFRAHLLRYIRTFLEGTVTPQGILRISAEALALRIADSYQELDAWWTRAEPELVSRERRGDDAALTVLGLSEAVVAGTDPHPARVTGAVDLAAGVDLRQNKMLRLKLDAAPALTIDLAAGAADAAAVSLAELLSTINCAAGAAVAGAAGTRLVLAAPGAGLTSRLDILDGADDAAPALLGLAPLQYRGRAAAAATVTALVELSAGADLSAERYLRLLVDGSQLREIDCAGVDPAHTSLAEIAAAINAAFGFPLASHDGARLSLTSPTQGLSSRIEFQTPAAQDATRRLFGTIPPLVVGAAAAPARLVGSPDLSLGVDLRAGSELSLKVDGGAALLVDCAGANPAQTLLGEIVAAINTAFGAAVASHNSRQLILTSPTSGPTGLIALQTSGADAAAPLFGLQPRSFQGGSAAAARLTGRVDLSGGIDLAARYRLQLALDAAEPVTINLRSSSADRRAVNLAELATAVNAALGATVAGHDGQHLILTAPTVGASSRLAILPLERELRRRFVTRATIIDEAAPAVFGFIVGEAQGIAATAARLEGSADLSRGVDLRQARYLRLRIDQHPAVEIDCAGPRPRATLPGEVTAAINAAAQSALGLEPVASDDGKRLLLVSPTAGAGSRILLEPPQAADALNLLLGVAPQTVKGATAGGVRLVGTVPLTAGVDLPANAAISLGLDGNPAVEIALTGAAPEHKNLNQLMLAINLALGVNLASHDGRYLILTSPTTGAGSRLDFAAPAGSDVAAQIFGFAAPRSYRGTAALAAALTGSPDLGAGSDLRRQRFLRLGVDGQPSQDIDCAAGAADPAAVSAGEIAATINAQTGLAVATIVAGRLQLTSPTSGAGSRLVLERSTGSNATARLFGAGNSTAQGSEPIPAVLRGQVDLRQPVDLSQRQTIRLAIDARRPLDLPLAGAAADKTFGDEIVAAINSVIPGLAQLSAEGFLQLTSPTAGEGSAVALLPLRTLELIEYPAEPRRVELALHHGEGFYLRNDGAAEVDARVEFFAPQGAVGPGLVNFAADGELRLLTVLQPGEGARLWHDPHLGLRAARIHADGQIEALPAAQLWWQSLEGGGRSAEALRVRRGKSRWLLLSCQVSRFDRARFDADRFAGGPCRSLGIFDVSRFVDPAAPSVSAVFAPTGSDGEPPMEVRLQWHEHLPGAFTVHLPADLPARFGGRFNQARFALAGEKTEIYAFAVTEPASDPDYLPALLNTRSALVRAQVVPSVPLGWQAVEMPFRKPRSLTLGSETQPARIYLAEEGFAGVLELEARLPGAAGNSIAVTARKVGPALFDVSVAFQGARFENARQLVLGEPLPALTEKLLQPGPVGIRQAKAAGTRAAVTRDGTQPQP